MTDPGGTAEVDAQRPGAARIEMHPELNVIGLAAQILRHKRIVLKSAGVTLLLGLILCFILPSRYTADTEILPPQHRQNSASALLSEASAGSLAAGLSGAIESKSSADLYARMLVARPVLETLIKRFDLIAVYKLSNLPDTARKLTDRTAVTASKEGLITIEVTDGDPKRAAGLANAYPEALQGLMQGLALTESSQRRVFYEQQLAQAKDNLAQAEVGFRKMQQNNKMISLGDQAKALIEAAASLRAQIAAKEVQLQGLRSYSTETNPQVQIAEKELAALRGELAKSEARDESGYTGMGLNSVPNAELGFVRASRELRYQEELYSIMLRQYEAARLDEARDVPMLQVIEPAVPPLRKSFPRRPLVLLGALITGLIVGLAIVLTRIWAAGLSAAEREQLAELRRSIGRA